MNWGKSPSHMICEAVYATIKTQDCHKLNFFYILNVKVGDFLLRSEYVVESVNTGSTHKSLYT